MRRNRVKEVVGRGQLALGGYVSLGENGRAVVETRGVAHVSVNAHVPAVLNGHANGTANGHANGTSNGRANGTSNGQVNGLVKAPEPTEAAEAVPKIVFTAEDRERLVASHIPLVHRLCRRFRDCGEPQEDLVQVGCIGLLKASKKFDPDRGISFITYAVPVIVGEVKNYLRDHGWAVKVPRKIQKQKLAVQRAVESLGHSLGRSPTFTEIAEATEITEAEVFDTFEVGNYGRPLSLDAEYDGNGSKDVSTVLDYIGAEDPRFEKLGDRMDLGQTFSSLTTREKAIIYMKFYVGLSQTEIAKRIGISQTEIGLSQTEIAKRIGISQMHVSRLQRHALGLLREGLAK